MSSKLIATFLLLFFISSLFHEIMVGGGGTKVATLSANVTAVAVILPVTHTSGFLESDYVQIGTERVRYTGTTATSFTGCTRGYDGTTAAAHGTGSKVYSSGSMWSGPLGFNVATTGSTAGEINMATVALSFFTVTVPKLVTWDFAIYLAFNAAMALGGVLQSVFRRV
jgi:hypothetical protein